MHVPTLPVQSRRHPTGIVVYLSVTHLTKLSRLNAPKAAKTSAGTLTKLASIVRLFGRRRHTGASAYQNTREAMSRLPSVGTSV